MVFYVLIPIFIVLVVFIFYKKKNGITINPKSAIKINAEPVNDNYKAILNKEVTYYQKLSSLENKRFEKLLNLFLKSVHIEGVGTEITDSDRVLIASSAIIPIFGFPEWEYANLTNIILYPDTFDKNFQFEGENRNILGMVGSGFLNGQMLLSRTALVQGFSKSSGKENAAIHEFVHLQDNSDGETDGVPENLMAHEYVLPWLNMIHQEMHRIEKGKSDINPYAITSKAEFFAVVSEYFFEKPEQLKEKHPVIYATLSKLFKQNPAK